MQPTQNKSITPLPFNWLVMTAPHSRMRLRSSPNDAEVTRPPPQMHCGHAPVLHGNGSGTQLGQRARVFPYPSRTHEPTTGRNSACGVAPAWLQGPMGCDDAGAMGCGRKDERCMLATRGRGEFATDLAWWNRPREEELESDLMGENIWIMGP
jgi:hypothetical protein